MKDQKDLSCGGQFLEVDIGTMSLFIFETKATADVWGPRLVYVP